jgi:hypothetical protein
MRTAALIAIAWAALASAARGGELGHPLITRRLDDPAAIYVEKGAFGAKGDGTADDAPAIQAAIDALREKRGQGVVFLAAGRYRLGRTIDLWKGIRIVGFGAKRPTLLLAGKTPGFGGKDGMKYLVHFRDAWRKDGKRVDARNTTFGSGLINLDMEIAPGSGAYAAVRYHVAQLCTVRDVDFRLAGDVEAAFHAIGNEIYRCRFFGGRHAVVTGRTSAGWQALLMDCVFEKQTVAAIRTESAGLTVLGCTFAGAPAGIVVPEGRIERLVVDGSRFESIPGGAVVCDGGGKASNQINLTDVVCRDVPKLLVLRGGGGEPNVPGATYHVRSLSHGLLASVGSRAVPRIGLTGEVVPGDGAGARPGRATPATPPCATWVNARALGAVGDGRTDDTAALEKAVAGHDAVYLPVGKYLISKPLVLRERTALIGLHPRATQFVLGKSAAAFADPGKPKGVVVAPPGGRCIVAGLAIAPGEHPGAAALEWRAGTESLVDDVHVPYGAGGGRLYGLWVAEGGGGTFKSLWIPNERARNGMVVSDTDTPGRAILCSIEHHPEVEVVLEKVRNWTFHALQTEAEGDGHSMGVSMTGCEEVTFTNLFLYRTSRTKKPHPHGVRAAGCRHVVFRGVHNFSLSKFPYESTVVDADTGAAVGLKEAAYVVLEGKK